MAERFEYLRIFFTRNAGYMALGIVFVLLKCFRGTK